MGQKKKLGSFGTLDVYFRAINIKDPKPKKNCQEELEEEKVLSDLLEETRKPPHLHASLWQKGENSPQMSKEKIFYI